MLVLSFVWPVAGESLALPERPPNALGAAALIEKLSPMSLAEREQTIIAEIKSGNVPEFLCRLVDIPVTESIDGREVTATIAVTPEYLAIGSDEDFLFTPLTPLCAQQVADDLGCLLPTPKLVDKIHYAAALKLDPLPIPPTPAMTTVPVFAAHHAALRVQRDPLLAGQPWGTLVAGQKKDVVITPNLFETPASVAIYGWHRKDHQPIQPLHTGHTQSWVDYSHGMRKKAALLRAARASRHPPRRSARA